jgi:hypothetical protein
MTREFCINYPNLRDLGALLPESDLQVWKRVVSLRNRLAYDGPCFVDYVDTRAGRVWRKHRPAMPLEKQAEEIWRLSRILCESPLVTACIAIQGIPPGETRKKLIKAEKAKLVGEPREGFGLMISQAINEFHARSTSPQFHGAELS